MAAETLHRLCPICEAGCGLLMTVDRERREVLSIKGDPEHPHSRGYVCPRSQAIRYVYEDPERLRHPVRRLPDGQWQEIGWEEAYTLVDERLAEVRQRHGKHAVGFYYGNPNISDIGSMLYLPLFIAMLETERFYSPTSVDQLPRNLASQLLYGGAWLIPIPDIDRTDFFVCMGANPVVSQGSLMSAPGMPRRLEALRARGGRLVVVDPRRTETAAMADQHLFIRPGTDALFLFAWVNELFARDALRLGPLQARVDGLEELRRMAAPFTPERVAATCGVPAATLRQLVSDFLAAEAPVLYGRLGLCTQAFGTLASWLVDVINILCGRLDAPGGAMFPRPYLGQSEFTGECGELPFGRWRTRVRGLPEFEGQLPAVAMAEEITDAPEDERLRALITIAGNPVLTVPEGGVLRDALQQLEFQVAVDFYINETTAQADVILPPTTKLESVVSNLFYAMTAVHNTAHIAPATFDPEPGAQHQWQILLNIAARVHGLRLEDLDDMVMDGLIATLLPVLPGQTAEGLKALAGEQRGPERLLTLLLRAGPYGDRFQPGVDGLALPTLMATPGGVDLGPMQPWLTELLRTPGKRIALVHDLYRQDIDRLTRSLDVPARAPGEYLMIGRRHVRDMNSWLHNIEQYVRGRPRCTLRVHPDDAHRDGLVDGGQARVSSPTGELVVEVEVTDEVMPGVVSLPHGFGHRYGDTRQSRATGVQPGVSCNDLIARDALDIAGTSIVNGAPVRVLPV